MLLATARSPLLRGLALALAVHVAARAVGLAVLALMARTAGLDPVPRLAIWDGGWYLRIAEGGYADRLDPAVEATGSLAFYPLYPLLIRAVSTVTGLDGPTAGVLLSELAAAVAAAGLYLLATRLWDRRTGVALVALWSAQPLSIVLSMVYTEALFTALAVWALVALHRRQWLTTGLLALFAGLTRSSGLGVAAAVAAYAGWLWWRGQERTGRQILATALATAGPPLWWLWVGLRVDRLDGWFAVQDQIWGSRWDWGGSVMSLAAGMFTQQVRYGGEAVFVIAVTFALLIAAVLLLLEAVAQRVWWPLLVYAAVLLALTLGSAGYINSKPRFLVPIFPLLIPLALAAARAPQRVQLVGGALVLLGSAWFGAYLLVVWPFAI